jgi:hypothetical protein
MHTLLLLTRHICGCLGIGSLAAFESLLRRESRKEMCQAGDNACPSRLVAGAEAGPVIAVEVFVKQQAIAPMRIFLKLSGSSIDGAAAIFVSQEDVSQSARDLLAFDDPS